MPNWRSKETPTPRITRIEEVTDMIKEEPTKITPEPTSILALLEMDNNPLEELWINVKTNISQKLAIQETADKKEKTLEEMIPLELHDFKDIFDKKTAEQFPES